LPEGSESLLGFAAKVFGLPLDTPVRGVPRWRPGAHGNWDLHAAGQETREPSEVFMTSKGSML